jgi:acyl-coenzyme A thioesterase PaaI-like protein
MEELSVRLAMTPARGRASGEALVARGQLVKHGRRIVVGRAEVFSIAASEEALVAVFQGTMAVRSTP